MNFVLEIKYHATNSQYFFTDRAAADAVVADLTPKIGRERWSRNDDDTGTHTFAHDFGVAVVVCSKIESISVMDANVANAAANRRQDVLDQEYIRRKKIIQAALKDDHSASEASS